MIEEADGKKLIADLQTAVKEVLTNYALAYRGQVYVQYERRWDRSTGTLTFIVEVDG